MLSHLKVSLFKSRITADCGDATLGDYNWLAKRGFRMLGRLLIVVINTYIIAHMAHNLPPRNDFLPSEIRVKYTFKYFIW